MTNRTSSRQRPAPFDVFTEKRLAEYLRHQRTLATSELADETDDYLMNVDETELKEYFFQRYSVQPPHLDFNNIKVSTGTRPIPANRHPPNFFFRDKGVSIERGVLIYHIPYNGDPQLLRCYSDQYATNPFVGGYVEDGDLCFEMIDFYNDLARIGREAEPILRQLKMHLSRLVEDVDNYNYSLEWNIESAIKSRKDHIETVVKVLGIPIKKRDGIEQSYLVPTAESVKRISLKPQISQNGRDIEFSLDESVYEDILQVTHDVGKVFERLPSTYRQKKEELRYLLFALLAATLQRDGYGRNL